MQARLLFHSYDMAGDPEPVLPEPSPPDYSLFLFCWFLPHGHAVCDRTRAWSAPLVVYIVSRRIVKVLRRPRKLGKATEWGLRFLQPDT